MRQHLTTLTRWMPAVVLAAALVFAMTENSDAQDTITTSSGLRYIDHEAGAGEQAKAGDNVVVHYTGWLYNDGEKGKQVRLLARPQPALLLPAWRGPRYRRLG